MTTVVMSITGIPKGTFVSACSAEVLNSMMYLTHTEEQGRNKILNHRILHTKQNRNPGRTMMPDEGWNQSLGNFSSSMLYPLKAEVLNIHWCTCFQFFFKANKLNRTNFMLWYHMGYKEIGCFDSITLFSAMSTNTATERTNGLLHPGSQR